MLLIISSDRFSPELRVTTASTVWHFSHWFGCPEMNASPLSVCCYYIVFSFLRAGINLLFSPVTEYLRTPHPDSMLIRRPNVPRYYSQQSPEPTLMPKI